MIYTPHPIYFEW